MNYLFFLQTKASRYALLTFPSNVNKNHRFWNFEGFSRSGALCFPGELLLWGKKRMNKIGEYGFEPGLHSSSFGELSEFRDHNRFIIETLQLRKSSVKGLHTAHYLNSIECSIPPHLISAQRYGEMKKLASYFPEAISSFFGFESRLSSPEAHADYLFAVSSLRNEREKLAALIKKKTFPEEYLATSEWQNICRFVLEWASPESVLYQKILGMWFEFDMVENQGDIPIPCIFLHTIPLRRTGGENIGWLTQMALPLISGKKLPEKIEQNVQRAIDELPKEAVIMDAGIMLSRPVSGVRFIIAKIQPNHIIPYLEKLGWSEEHDHLSTLLKELKRQVTRIVLHITLTEQGIDKKIGIECSFTSDRYHLETRWVSFFDYLVDKGVCIPQKKDALLQFMGIDQEDVKRNFDSSIYKPTVKIPDDDFSSALVRYISHVKLVYGPDQQISAKAYPGVRLFGALNTIRDESSCK